MLGHCTTDRPRPKARQTVPEPGDCCLSCQALQHLFISCAPEQPAYVCSLSGWDTCCVHQLVATRRCTPRNKPEKQSRRHSAALWIQSTFAPGACQSRTGKTVSGSRMHRRSKTCLGDQPAVTLSPRCCGRRLAFAARQTPLGGQRAVKGEPERAEQTTDGIDASSDTAVCLKSTARMQGFWGVLGSDPSTRCFRSGHQSNALI